MDLNKNLSIKLCFECFKPKRYLKSCDWTYNFLLKDNKTGKMQRVETHLELRILCRHAGGMFYLRPVSSRTPLQPFGNAPNLLKRPTVIYDQLLWNNPAALTKIWKKSIDKRRDFPQNNHTNQMNMKPCSFAKLDLNMYLMKALIHAACLRKTNHHHEKMRVVAGALLWGCQGFGVF